MVKGILENNNLNEIDFKNISPMQIAGGILGAAAILAFGRQMFKKTFDKARQACMYEKDWPANNTPKKNCMKKYKINAFQGQKQILSSKRNQCKDEACKMKIEQEIMNIDTKIRQLRSMAGYSSEV